MDASGLIPRCPVNHLHIYRFILALSRGLGLLLVDLPAEGPFALLRVLSVYEYSKRRVKCSRLRNFKSNLRPPRTYRDALLPWSYGRCSTFLLSVHQLYSRSAKTVYR